MLVDENNQCKLADFGTASIIGENDILIGARGTYEFLAPECCDPGSKNFSGKGADVWALGATIYCLAFNEVPFQSNGTGMSVLKAIQTLPLDFEGKRSISEGLKRLLLCVLEKDPTKRYTLDQMKKDEWVNEGMTPLTALSSGT